MKKQMTKDFFFNSEKYSKFVGQLLFMKMKLREIIAIVNFTLSFNKGPKMFWDGPNFFTRPKIYSQIAAVTIILC